MVRNQFLAIHKDAVIIVLSRASFLEQMADNWCSTNQNLEEKLHIRNLHGKIELVFVDTFVKGMLGIDTCTVPLNPTHIKHSRLEQESKSFVSRSGKTFPFYLKTGFDKNIVYSDSNETDSYGDEISSNLHTIYAGADLDNLYDKPISPADPIHEPNDDESVMVDPLPSNYNSHVSLDNYENSTRGTKKNEINGNLDVNSMLLEDNDRDHFYESDIMIHEDCSDKRDEPLINDNYPALDDLSLGTKSQSINDYAFTDLAQEGESFKYMILDFDSDDSSSECFSPVENSIQKCDTECVSPILSISHSINSTNSLSLCDASHPITIVEENQPELVSVVSPSASSCKASTSVKGTTNEGNTTYAFSAHAPNDLTDAVDKLLSPKDDLNGLTVQPFPNTLTHDAVSEENRETCPSLVKPTSGIIRNIGYAAQSSSIPAGYSLASPFPINSLPPVTGSSRPFSNTNTSPLSITINTSACYSTTSTAPPIVKTSYLNCTPNNNQLSNKYPSRLASPIGLKSVTSKQTTTTSNSTGSINMDYVLVKLPGSITTVRIPLSSVGINKQSNSIGFNSGTMKKITQGAHTTRMAPLPVSTPVKSPVKYVSTAIHVQPSSSTLLSSQSSQFQFRPNVLRVPRPISGITSPAIKFPPQCSRSISLTSPKDSHRPIIMKNLSYTAISIPQVVPQFPGVTHVSKTVNPESTSITTKCVTTKSARSKPASTRAPLTCHKRKRINVRNIATDDNIETSISAPTQSSIVNPHTTTYIYNPVFQQLPQSSRFGVNKPIEHNYTVRPVQRMAVHNATFPLLSEQFSSAVKIPETSVSKYTVNDTCPTLNDLVHRLSSAHPLPGFTSSCASVECDPIVIEPRDVGDLYRSSSPTLSRCSSTTGYSENEDDNDATKIIQSVESQFIIQDVCTLAQSDPVRKRGTPI